MDYKKMAKMYGEDKGMSKADMDSMNAKLDKGEVPAELREYADKKKKEMDKSEDPEKDKEMEDKKMDKSLSKAIDLFDELLSKSEQSRQEALLAKAQTGSLTDAERDELVKSLNGAKAEGGLVDDVVKSMTPETSDGEQMAKAMDIDVNGYLSGIHQGITSSLEQVAESLEKGFQQRSEREYVLAKGMRDLCVVVESQAQKIADLQKSLDNWGSAPARGPKSQPVGHLEKSFVGEQPGSQKGDTLSKSEAYAVLEALGRRGIPTVAGMDCGQIAAYIETTGQMPNAGVAHELSKIARQG